MASFWYSMYKHVIKCLNSYQCKDSLNRNDAIHDVHNQKLYLVLAQQEICQPK